MPRGDNPNSRANLIKKEDRTPKERRESAKKAGVASGKARAIYKSLSEDLKEQCTPEEVHALNAKLKAMAMHGNLKAYELIRDGLGEKPVNEISIRDTSSEELDEYFRRTGEDEEPSEE